MKKFVIVVSLFFTFLTVFSGNVSADSVFFTSTPVFFASAGSEYSYKVAATSSDNSPITFSFTNLPSWLSFNTSTDTLHGSTTATGRYSIFITATDKEGDSEQQNYYLYVQAVSPTPTATPSSTPLPTSTPKPTPTQTPAQVTSTPKAPSPTQKVTSTPLPTTSGTVSIQFTDLSPKDGAKLSNTNVTI